MGVIRDSLIGLGRVVATGVGDTLLTIAETGMDGLEKAQAKDREEDDEDDNESDGGNGSGPCGPPKKDGGSDEGPKLT